MKRYRFVDEAALLKRVAVEVGGKPLKSLERWLSRQPRSPRLVGATEAAKILNVHAPRVTRLREQGRMPEPFEVEGGSPIYVRSEVEALAREIAVERREREAGLSE